MNKKHRLALFLVLFFLMACAAPQSCQELQSTNCGYESQVTEPSYSFGSGPVVLADENYNSRHPINESYFPFKKVLEADGYRVDRLNLPVETSGALDGTDILIIVSPQETPSVSAENRIVDFICLESKGLLLITDHPQFPPFLQSLAGRFGVELQNVGVNTPDDALPCGGLIGCSVFTKGGNHAITELPMTEGIGQVSTFFGTGFGGVGLVPLLTFGQGSNLKNSEGDIIGQANGLHQAAMLSCNDGRVAVLGEAGAWTSQTTTSGTMMGLGNPAAQDNEKMILRIMGCLGGALSLEECGLY